MADRENNLSELKATLDSDIQRGGITITQFLEKKGIDGGVALDEKGKSSSSASSILVDQAGKKYDIGSKVAAGGMGAILQAKDLNIRRTVAMKVLLDPKRANDEQILRFIEEAQITGQMEHPSIVPVHELGVDSSGNVFYTMKFIKGDNLDKILAGIKDGDAELITKYPLNSLLNIFLKICEAMSFAHTKGVVHRDLKPENIMVGEFGEALVMDWGLGKVLGSKEEEAEDTSAQIESARTEENIAGSGAMTMEGQLRGTPLYMAPEQAYGRISEIDQRTDIYALGAILYQILTLHPPIEGTSVNEVLMKVAKGQIEPPTKYEKSHKLSLPHLPGGHIPPALSSVALKALSLRKEERYQDVKALQKDIEAYQGGFATSAEKAGVIKQFWLLAKRHKGFVTAAALVLLSIMLGLVISLAQWRKAVANEKVASASMKKAQAAEESEKEIRKKAEWEAYVAKIQLADRKIAEGDIISAKNTLESCPQYLRNWEWGYLMGLCPREEAVFNVESIWLCKVSADGKRMITGSHKAKERILWDVQGARELKRLDISYLTKPASTFVLSISPDGQTIIMARDSDISLFDLESSRVLWTQNKEGYSFQKVIFMQDNSHAVISASLDTDKKKMEHALWDIREGKEIRKLNEGSIPIIVSPDGRKMSFSEDVGSNLHRTKIYDTQKGDILLTTEGWHEYSVFSPDGSRLAGGCWNGSVVELDLTTGKTVLMSQNTGAAISTISYSPEGDYIFSGDAGGAVHVWESKTGRMISKFTGHSEQVLKCVLLPYSKSLLTAANESKYAVRIWPFQQLPQKVIIPFSKPSMMGDLEFLDDGRAFISELQGKNSFFYAKGIWNQAVEQRSIGPSGVRYGYSTVSRDGRYMLMFDKDKANTLVLHNLQTKKNIWSVQQDTKLDMNLGFSNTGRYVKAGPFIRDAASGQIILDLKISKIQWNNPHWIAFSPDDSCIAICPPQSSIVIWDLVSRKENRTFIAMDSPWSVTFSPDGKYLLVGYYSGYIRFWNIEAGTCAWEIKMHSQAVCFAEFSPDGKRIISGSNDHTVRIWEPNTQNELLKFSGIIRQVSWGRFSPDQRELVIDGRTDGKEGFTIFTALDWTKTSDELRKESTENWRKRWSSK